jgi:hypothetical protein
MSNITESLNKLADGQVSIYAICKKLADRQANTHDILGMLVNLSTQFELAIGADPSAQKFDEINAKIVAAQTQSQTDLAAIDGLIEQSGINKNELYSMAFTPFDQPPAPEPPAA